MPGELLKTDRPAFKRWLSGATVVFGLLAIAFLTDALMTIFQDHMARATETSRHTQWQVNAPIAGARAAGVLQGSEPAPSP